MSQGLFYPWGSPIKTQAHGRPSPVPLVCSPDKEPGAGLRSRRASDGLRWGRTQEPLRAGHQEQDKWRLLQPSLQPLKPLPASNALQRNLEAQGVALHRVPGDGDCQFQAMAAQLSLHRGYEGSAAQLRGQAVDWLRQSGELSLDDGQGGQPMAMGGSVFDEEGHPVPWQQYIASMQQHEWGDERTLLAVSVLFNTSICVIQDDDTADPERYMRMISPPASLSIQPRDVLVLAYSNRNHYDSTRPLH